MATAEKRPTFAVDPELQDAINRVILGVRDPEAMKKAAERMDRMREEMRQRVGEVNVAVELLRETRDGE